MLVNPFYRRDPHGSFGKHVLTPSLALTSIAAATPDDWTVTLWDENLLQGPPPTDPFPWIVGITVHLTFARRAFQLARWYRERGALVVLGGMHVCSCPDECAPHADALAIGDGVPLWPRILRDAEHGRLERRYSAPWNVPFRLAPAPRRTLLARRDFLTRLSVIATRGCRNRCSFCWLSTEGVGMPYQTRDVEQVVREIAVAGDRYAVFLDNNLAACRRYLRELCDRLAPLERIWSAAVSLDVADDPDLVARMGRSGCVGVFVGFESLSEENLRGAHKGGPGPESFARAIELFHRHGIAVNGSFVFGFDEDDETCFERTVRFVERTRMECATFHILTPYPGTPLYQRIEAEGRLLHRNWDLYDTAHAVFRPRRMSPEQLEKGYAWAYRELFSPRSIWRRRPEEIARLPGYLAGNLLYKKANPLWPWLIRHRLTGPLWAPLVALQHRRHVAWRRRRRNAPADESGTGIIPRTRTRGARPARSAARPAGAARGPDTEPTLHAPGGAPQDA